jgi:hypothetical protein
MLPDNKPHPVVQCICGWLPDQIFDSWEDAGRAFDAHIRASLKEKVEVARAGK